MPKKLTPKQAAFVEHYLVDLNATQAAIRAGYSQRTAAAVGSENLRKPHIAVAVSEAQAARSERVRVTADMVVEELARIGFSDMRRLSAWSPSGVRLLPSEALEDADAACVAQVQATKTVNTDRYGNVTETENTTLRLHDKLGALNSLGRHLGMFKDNLNVTQDRPFTIRVRGLAKDDA